MSPPSGSSNQNPADGIAAIRHLHYRVEVLSYDRTVLLRLRRDEVEDLTFHLSPALAERLANRLLEAARLGRKANGSAKASEPASSAPAGEFVTESMPDGRSRISYDGKTIVLSALHARIWHRLIDAKNKEAAAIAFRCRDPEVFLEGNSLGLSDATASDADRALRESLRESIGHIASIFPALSRSQSINPPL